MRVIGRYTDLIWESQPESARDQAPYYAIGERIALVDKDGRVIIERIVHHLYAVEEEPALLAEWLRQVRPGPGVNTPAWRWFAFIEPDVELERIAASPTRVLLRLSFSQREEWEMEIETTEADLKRAADEYEKEWRLAVSD